jgi:hypothetical protein
VKFIFISLFISSTLLACITQSLYSDDIIYSLNEFSGSFNDVIDNQVCSNLKDIKDKDAYKKELKSLVQNQTNDIWKIKNRHKMGVALNQCEPNKESKALVISFSGTGAYNPRTHILMANLIQCQNTKEVPSWIRKYTYTYLKQILKDKGSAYTKWSGLDKGPLSLFLNDEELNQKARYFNFANFASEESEAIADPEKINSSSAGELYKDIIQSVSGFPTGIVNALVCTSSYFKKAKELNIKPKLIVQSHSSGGRSVVKYLEHLKEHAPKVEADLVLTIDPVKEAHHAIGEVADQYAGKVGTALIDFIPFVDPEPHDKPVNVWSRKQPKSLYKTSNTKKWINFYQNEDKNGIDLPVKFGIHGSPIHNADNNYFIKDVGRKGHGAITYDERVSSKIKKEVLALFE